MARASKIIGDAASRLAAAGIEDSAREAEMLLMHTMGIRREAIYAHDPEVGHEAARAMDAYVARRITREPIQYIIGRVEFMGLDILVGPGVLVPRPETEMMAAEARRILSDMSASRAMSAPRALDTLRVLDLCTGSGCLALALAPAASHLDAVDISEQALSYARRSAELNNIANVSFLHGDLFAPVAGRKYAMIVSNPPYIVSADIDALQPEVSRHEPRAALDGGADGLAFYRRIVEAAPGHLDTGGVLMLELGVAQHADVRAMAMDAGFDEVRSMRDLAGIERVLIAALK